MIPMFLAQRIIIQKMTFDDVPPKLKGQVAEILLDSGCGELITDEAYRH